MDSMFNTPQEVVQANMNGAVKKAATSKKKVFFMGIMAGVFAEGQDIIIFQGFVA